MLKTVKHPKMTSSIHFYGQLDPYLAVKEKIMQ